MPALRTLGHRAPVDVKMHAIPSERLPTPIEHALFALVADAAATAKRALDVAIERCNSNVEMRILGADSPCAQVVADRIAALNGSVTSDDSRIRVVIPCAS